VGKIQTSPLEKLSERQCCSGLCEEEKILLRERGIEPLYHIRPIYRLVTLPEEPFRLPSQTTSWKAQFNNRKPHWSVGLYHCQIVLLSIRSTQHNRSSSRFKGSSCIFDCLYFASLRLPRGERQLFKSESKSTLHTTKATHYGCYKIGSILYL
jgi:hypothetical protein